MSRRWLGPVVVAAMLAFALAVYPSLPERVPTHWGLSGEPDDWMPKWPGAFLPAAMAAGVWLLLVGLRRIDPRRAHYEKFDETYWLLVNLLVLFMALVEVVALGAALGWPLDVARVMLLAAGLLFVALGNYLPRVRSNWWMGIRTPWTLESERVWRETHRVAGWSFVFGGVVTMVAALLPLAARPWVALAGLVVAGFVPVVYSYVLYRRERSGRPA
ncbi:MAG TPA: SdpI family protein [Longimicrobiales bacterium]